MDSGALFDPELILRAKRFGLPIKRIRMVERKKAGKKIAAKTFSKDLENGNRADCPSSETIVV
jgi:hypothetical protein